MQGHPDLQDGHPGTGAGQPTQKPGRSGLTPGEFDVHEGAVTASGTSFTSTIAAAPSSGSRITVVQSGTRSTPR